MTPQRPPVYWPRPDGLEPSPKPSRALSLPSSALGVVGTGLALFPVAGVAVVFGTSAFALALVVLVRRRQLDVFALAGLVLGVIALTGGLLAW